MRAYLLSQVLESFEFFFVRDDVKNVKKKMLHHISRVSFSIAAAIITNATLRFTPRVRRAASPPLRVPVVFVAFCSDILPIFLFSPRSFA